MLQLLKQISNWNSGRALQYAAAFTATITFLMAGMFTSWTSPCLPRLQAEDSPIPVTRNQGSWIVSLSGVGGILAPFPAGYLANKFGRKPLLVFVGLPVLLSWLLIIFARSATEILVSRVVAGLSTGISFSICPIYLAEIAEDSIRGILGSLMQLMMNLGTMYSYAIGPYVSYTALGSSSAVFPVLFVLLMIFMPETPHYFLMKDRRAEAEISLMRLRGQKNQLAIQEEMEKMHVSVAEQMKNKGTLRDLVATRGTRRAMIVMIGLIFIQQFGGIMAILSNTQEIFDLTPGSTLSSSESVIVVGAIQIIASIFTSSLVDRVGRRPLLLVSTSGCAVSLAVLGAYHYAKTTSFSWIPLTCLVVFLVTYCLGVGPLPIAMMGEMFPSNIRGLALSIGSMLLSFTFMVITKLYQLAIDNLGPYITFWFFASVSAAGVFFVFFVVPETKGKSLENIVSELNGEKKPIASIPPKVYTIA